MIRMTVKVDGMMCGMCEAHVNSALRAALRAALSAAGIKAVKKVTSDRRKGEAVILTEQDVDDAILAAAIRDSGYTFRGVTREEAKPRGLRALFKK